MLNLPHEAGFQQCYLLCSPLAHGQGQQGATRGEGHQLGQAESPGMSTWSTCAGSVVRKKVKGQAGILEMWCRVAKRDISEKPKTTTAYCSSATPEKLSKERECTLGTGGSHL
jgi:hypothetical protein